MRNVNWESSKTDTIILLPSKRVQRTPVKVSTVDSRREFSVLEGNERRTSPRRRSALLLRRAKIRTLAHGVRYIPYVWPEERTHTSPILSCSLSRIQKLFLSMNLDDPNRSTARLVSWISSWEARRTRFVGARGVTGTRGIVKAMHCKELTTTIPSLRPSRVRARARARARLPPSRSLATVPFSPFFLRSLPPSLSLSHPFLPPPLFLSLVPSLSLSLCPSYQKASTVRPHLHSLVLLLARSLGWSLEEGALGRSPATLLHLSTPRFRNFSPPFFFPIEIPIPSPFLNRSVTAIAHTRSLARVSRKGERERPKDSEVTTSGIQYYRFLSLVTLGPTWSSPRDPCRRRRFRASRSFDLTRARL